MSNGRVSCASFLSTQWFLVTNIGLQPTPVWFRVPANGDHRRVEFRGVGAEAVLNTRSSWSATVFSSGLGACPGLGIRKVQKSP